MAVMGNQFGGELSAELALWDEWIGFVELCVCVCCLWLFVVSKNLQEKRKEKINK
jgi:hypothetical protein